MSLHERMQKVTAEHTKKLAYVYVRQSTLRGVKENIVGGQRQRDVDQLALQLGWPKEHIRVVDEDQARSGSTTEGRYGYVDMLNDVADGRVGAVFSLETTRVGRDSADWHILIKMCDHTGTLVIHPQGIYDASDVNDNTIMKINALLAEMELRWITERLVGAKRALAAKGELRCLLPIGYIYDEDKKMILDPNEDVQKMIRLVFSLFRVLGSANKVARFINDKGMKFPVLVRSGSRKGMHDWIPLGHSRVCCILRNPAYAGTYVVGRTKVKKKTARKEGEAPKVVKYQERLRRDDWEFVFHDAHPAYITWAEYLENEKLLSYNRFAPSGVGIGAPREGSALLQGLVVCGKCGRRMSVKYPRPGVWNYVCNGERSRYGGRTCQSIVNHWIDSAVERAFLEALRPAQLEISLKALERLEEQAHDVDRQWESRLRRAEKAVAEAEERLLDTDHKNQHSYSRVQKHVEQKQAELALLERERQDEAQLTLKRLSPEEREAILALAQDFPRVWDAETTNMATRKCLLRCLITDVTLSRDSGTARIGIRWKSGAYTPLTVPPLTRPPCKHRLPSKVIELIKKLTPDHTDAQIAVTINDSGLLSGSGKTATRVWVKCVRVRYRIRRFSLDSLSDRDDDGRYSAAALTRILRVSRGVVSRWCMEGRLDGVQDPVWKRWRIRITPEEIVEFEKTIRRWPVFRSKRDNSVGRPHVSVSHKNKKDEGHEGVAL